MTPPKSKNILYLSANSSYSHSSLAYGQLRSISEQYAPQHKWNIVECTINDKPNELLLKITNKSPDVIISTLYLFNRNFILDIILKIALLLPKTKIVLGGPEFLGNNEKTLRQYPQVTAVFRGDESSFPEYINNRPMDKIPGICFITKTGEYLDNGKAIYQHDLDTLPSPYKMGYFENIPKQENINNLPTSHMAPKSTEKKTDKKALVLKPFIQLETSRGCPSRCSFCTSSLSEKVQYYSIDRVRSDLKHIEAAGIKEVRIVDRTFNLPSERARKLLKMFSKEFPHIKFHLEFDPGKVTEEIINQLSQSPSGQFHIEIGIQTLYPLSLTAIGRKSTKQKSLDGFNKLLNISQIEIHADLIYGLPEQTINSVFDDLKTLIKIGPTEIQLESLKVLPGTPLKNPLSSYGQTYVSALTSVQVQSVNQTTSGQSHRIYQYEGVLQYAPTPPYDVLSTRHMTLNDIIQFSYLSKIIDAYYNTKTMKSLFMFAVINNKSFLEKFLKFAAKRFSANEKPSISSRFKLLFDYAVKYAGKNTEYGQCRHVPRVSTDSTMNPDLFYSVILFSYFVAGFFQSPTDNIKLLKKDEVKKILEQNNTILWSDNKKTIDKPAYIASFKYNVGEIWLNPKAKPVKGEHVYLFLLSQGGMSKKVSKIISINQCN